MSPKLLQLPLHTAPRQPVFFFLFFFEELRVKKRANDLSFSRQEEWTLKESWVLTWLDGILSTTTAAATSGESTTMCSSWFSTGSEVSGTGLELRLDVLLSALLCSLGLVNRWYNSRMRSSCLCCSKLPELSTSTLGLAPLFVEFLVSTTMAESEAATSVATLDATAEETDPVATASAARPRTGRGLQRTLLNSSSGRIINPPLEVSSLPCLVIKWRLYEFRVRKRCIQSEHSYGASPVCLLRCSL